MYGTKDRDHHFRLSCSGDGRILSVLSDANGFFEGLPSPPSVDDILSISAQSVYRGFVEDVLKWGFALCESVLVKNGSGEYSFSLFGVSRGGEVFVVALQSPQHLFQVYEEFMQMINEQGKLLRETQKHAVARDVSLREEARSCSSSLNEMMKINNQLVSIQRQLKLKNKELEAAYEEIEKKNELLQEASRTDALTGLMNRRRLFERLEEELARARRYGEPLAVAMVDIDRFKDVNDTRGHQVGDGVLRAVAGRLGANARDADSIGRYGGEEFLILMPRTDLEGAATYAERVRAAVERLPLEDLDLHVTVSIGVAAYSGGTLLELVDRADRKLYQAKDNGRNRVES